MIVPVRCFSCGKPVAGLYQDFKERTDKGEDAGKVLDDLNVTRYCCRKTLLTSIDMTEELMKFQVKKK
ncbi:MAG: DNA-directed RNA polymerase subunit N [Candidatus Diapherotrites archaeon]|jgi:DNA-directed RNA polymerase subunit N|nr:DNA-directed RNA polymerase subunit N [Candidatus Diapherotrites archaeon]MBT4596423.1 DNA-directed RNA polymerase subunit N [Candidatus Diapherotrites archaeon]